MQQNHLLRGAILVFIGAMSYGILATIVKYANNFGIHTSVLTFMQFAIGFLFLFFYANVQKKKENLPMPVKKDKIKLLLFGTTFGMTSIFYYLSLRYIPVSMGIILLMQSIWMSLVLEVILTKKRPTVNKALGAIVILAGTILATNLLFETASIRWTGILLGMLSAVSYTISMYASSNIATNSSNSRRSLYLIGGGLLFQIFFWRMDLITHFTSLDGVYWGVLLALFGTIIPPLLFTKGIPLVGIGLGSIIAAVEIPVSILSAHLILGERMNSYQWLGVVFILISVVLVNWRAISKK